ncbi:NlpC/P60 family protein [Nocardioides cynanchi]|uniref:C40 family peptidase n=1 Tax=Nocardioides cynanchi TaxID=2558918 RepID=UPI0012484FF2|nr:C40 family peptidase [Nocardioides cynanchi]
MHRLGATALALSLVTGLGGVAAASAAEGRHVYPSRHQVQQAQHRAARVAHDVPGVRAELAAADQRMQAAAVQAEQAAEAYNGARWHLQQARREARVADRHARIAAADVSQQRASYAASVVSSYEMGPSLTPISAIQDSDGIGAVLSKLATLQNAQSAMDSTYDSFQASSTLAGVAQSQADQARARAQAMAVQARRARDAAAAAAAAATATSQQLAARKSRLLQQLAILQHLSVHLAEKRQAGIEAAARAAAQRAAEKAARAAAQQAAQQAQQTQQPQGSPGPGNGPTGSPSTPPTGQPSTPPTSPAPPPPPSGPPAPAAGAGAAIAFARAQIGDPYVWGATGPDAWDCSGLTMGAWRAGGISLPHYAAAQYDQSTPVSPGSLRPGDLVFWGSSSSPSSIYHVALYVGNGMIVQAPRTGRDVEEVSMYYWVAPNFYARP